MINIEVWTDYTPISLIFDNVEMYYETRKALEIIQDEQYKSTKSVIYKSHILRYTITEKR